MGRTRMNIISCKIMKTYPLDSNKKYINRSKFTKNECRSKIPSGAVLIILAGKHKGRRVIFLKQLNSNMLLINGPFKLNGVPLRRVNKAYVMVTRTILTLDDHFKERLSNNDLFFLSFSRVNVERKLKKK